MTAKNLPDRLVVKRRVHKGALTMLLRGVPRILAEKRAVYDDIAARINADNGTQLTGAELEANYQLDPVDGQLVRLGRVQQRYLLELTEQLVLEQAIKRSDKAVDTLDVVLEEVADRLSKDHKLTLTGEDLKQYDLERRPNGQATNVLIKKR